MMGHAAGGGGTDPYFANVSLLLHGNGTNGSTAITDSSGSPKTITLYGNTHIATANPKWGSGAIVMDGAGDYLDVPGQAFGTGDFTVEFQFLPSSLVTLPTLLDNRVVTPAASLVIYYPGSGFTFYAAGADRAAITADLATGVYHHIALCRASGITRLFNAGIQYGSNYADTNNYNHTTLRFGANLTGANSLNGQFDDIRVTTIARYTANFTPPTAQAPDS